MKTTSAFAATIFAIVLLFNSVYANAKNENNVSTRNNCTLTMAFYRTDTIMVVTPDLTSLTASDKSEIGNYVYFENPAMKPVYVFKSESELNSKDLKKHILLYGPISSFQRKDFLRIPVKKALTGFTFRHQVFNQPNDAFFYVNSKATRMYLCKNSPTVQTGFFTLGIGAYPLHIFRGNEIMITGVYM